jgi:hypothetical protein
MARTSSTTRIMTQTATVPGGTRRGAQVRDRKRPGREPSRDRRRRRAGVRACRRGPLFLHESNSTVVWLRHMRWWRRWQLAITIVWASGYERAKARHLVQRQNWKYCLLCSQPRPVTRTVNNRRYGRFVHQCTFRSSQCVSPSLAAEVAGRAADQVGDRRRPVFGPWAGSPGPGRRRDG